MKNIIDNDLKKITKNLIDSLEQEIDDDMIKNSFIRNIEIVDKNKNIFFILVKSENAANLINKNYKETINKIIKETINKNMSFEVITKRQNIKKTNLSNNILSKYTFNNYVKAHFNKEAIKIANEIINKKKYYSPFFITSKSGLGKTHFLHAVGNELIKKNISCNFINPNWFTRQITDRSKMGGNSINDFIDDLKKYDVLLFDDIQNLGDRAVTLKVFLEILNLYNENDKQIIIASDKLPRELVGFESRFITRFSSGLTTMISQPSIEDLKKILQFKLEEKKLSPEKWEKEALDFIVRNNSRSIRSIEGAIKRVYFYLEEVKNGKYTYAIVSNIFKELSIDQKELTHQRIISVISNYYKISKSDIISKKRKADIVIARHMAIWMVRKLLMKPLKEIGRIFGNRDHSTIMSSIKTIDKKMEINNIIKVAAEKIENKIKNIV